MYSFYDEQPEVRMGEGVKRRVLAHGGALMAVEVSFDKGAVGAIHAHPHEQVSYVVKGRFMYRLGDEERELAEGDSCFVKANLSHGVTAIEEGILLDVFTPQREDFLSPGKV
jgi:quercetin dioxygenase-like cupin family protein